MCGSVRGGRSIGLVSFHAPPTLIAGLPGAVPRRVPPCRPAAERRWQQRRWRRRAVTGAQRQERGVGGCARGAEQQRRRQPGGAGGGGRGRGAAIGGGSGGRRRRQRRQRHQLQGAAAVRDGDRGGEPGALAAPGGCRGQGQCGEGLGLLVGFLLRGNGGASMVTRTHGNHKLRLGQHVLSLEPVS